MPYTFYRVPAGQPLANKVTSNYAYTNEQFFVSRPLTAADFPASPAVADYWVQLTWTSSANTFVESYKAHVNNGVLTVFTESTPGNYDIPAGLYGGGQMGAGFGPFSATDPQSGFIPVAGGYSVTEAFFNSYPLITPYQTNPIPGTFDMRVLILDLFAATPRRFNPLSDDPLIGPCQITGTWKALPAATTNYPAGWKPSGDINWSIPINLGPPGSPVVTLTGTSAVSGPSSGVVGTLATSWNGRDTSGQVVEGEFNFKPSANAPTFDPLNSTATTIFLYVLPSITVVSTRCNCLDGSVRTSVPIRMIDHPVGPPIIADMSYTNLNAPMAAASMGSGWNSISNVRVRKDATTQNITYRDENGNYLSWIFNAGSYTPSTRDNYATILTGTVFPFFTITFRNKNKRLFNAAGQFINEVDTNSQTTTYTYTAGRLTSATDAKGRVVTWAYTGADLQPNSITASGHTTQLQYLGTGQLSVVTDPMLETTRYNYSLVAVNGLNQLLLTSIVDSTGKTAMAYNYDNLGRVTIETFYGQKQIRTYYSAKVVSVSNGTFQLELAVSVAKVEQDLTGSSPTKYTNSFYDKFFNVVRIEEFVDVNVSPNLVNPTVQVFADNNVPPNPYLLTQIIDPNLKVTSMTYSALGDLLSETDPFQSVTSYQYNAAGQVTHITRPAVTVGSNLVQYSDTIMGYDGNFNLTSVTNSDTPVAKTMTIVPNADGTTLSITDFNLHQTGYTYYTNGNLKTVTVPAHPGDASARVTTFTYDVWDNLKTTKDALNNLFTLNYDANRRLTSTVDALVAPDTPNTVTYTYGTVAAVKGLLTTVTEPSNNGSAGNLRKTGYTYDSANRVSQINRDLSTTSSPSRVQYVYDGFSNLIQQWRQQTANGVSSIHSWAYDMMGRPITSIDPLGRATVTVSSPFCRKTQVTTPRGVTRITTKDALCRVTKILTDKEGRSLAYDQLSRVVSDLAGSVYGVAKYGTDIYGNGRIFTYDSLDRVKQVLFSDGTSQNYTYDFVGNMLTFTDNFGVTTTYTYYDDDLLNTVSFSYASVAYLFTYNYDLAGRLTQIVYPPTSQITVDYVWNNNGWLLSMTYKKLTTVIQSFTYTYDNSGNRATMVEFNGTTTINWVYTYDWLNRLVNVTKNATQMAAYLYDNCDNRIQLTNAAGVFTYQVDAADQLISQKKAGALFETYLQDLDGNMVSRTLAAGSVTTLYGWNDFNSLTSFTVSGVSQETEVYDSSGTRRTKKDNVGAATQYYTSGGTSLAELRPTAANKVSFISGHLLLGLEQAGSVYFYLTDALGTVRQVVTSAGVGSATVATDEFGVQTASTGSAEVLTNTYVGGLGVRNETTARGLYYMNQRWNDPTLGRFISADPIGYRGGLNVWVYTSNDPISGVDPSGLVPLVPTMGSGPRLPVVRPPVSSPYPFSGPSSTCTTGTATAGLSPAVISALGWGTIVAGAVAAGYYGLQAIDGMIQESNSAEAWLETEQRRLFQQRRIRAFGKVGENEYTRLVKGQYTNDSDNTKKCAELERLYKKACGPERQKIQKAMKYLGCRNQGKRKEVNYSNFQWTLA